MRNYITDPQAIENKSFEIITAELLASGKGEFRSTAEARIIKRIIHTTADFEFFDLTRISDSAIGAGLQALQEGAHIVTDTRMAASGINKTRLAQLGSEVRCFIADPDVAEAAKTAGITRSMCAMKKAAQDPSNRIFAIGNAPTALFALKELIEAGHCQPALVIGVPVGFVGAAESKAALETLDVPYIITHGRKGGSAIAACIINAMMYML